MIQRLGILFLGLIIIYGCSKKAVPSSGSTAYSEDLSILHPVIAGSDYNSPGSGDAPSNASSLPLNTEYDITEDLDSLVLLIADKNLQKRFIDGYTIQVYSGANRDLANRARAEIQQLELDSPAQVVYVQPNFKVKVGKFYNRLEANKVFAQVKEVFPDALLLPEKIPVE
jgi:hypothetical protein